MYLIVGIGRMRIQDNGNLRIWEYGNIGIWEYGNMEFGILGIYIPVQVRHGHLTITLHKI